VPYNLDSPNRLDEPCDLTNLSSWYEREVALVASLSTRSVLTIIATNLDEFVLWPRRALLLWDDRDRVPTLGKKLKYHKYPSLISEQASVLRVKLDTRPNGPAIAAFEIAGGERPNRFGSRNAWSIHHLYSGKFPYAAREKTLHATKQGRHFTQSAGLVATHPIADAIGDEFPFFAWLLRAVAFQRFGYDPDGVFSEAQDDYGFANGHSCEILRALQVDQID
jgi:hypothetical protein